MTTKRLIDVLVSAAALAVLCPIIGAVAAAVRIGLGAPVLFRQLRPGLKGRPFEVIKFRTMKIEPALGNGISSDAQRLTPLGRLLRRTSLDELPQLWSVLRGDMSLVGPRPLLMQYLERYSPEQARRHEVRPGLTGWAQVNGRNALSWEEKFALDVWYVDNRTLWLDLKILFLTVRQVLSGAGVSSPGVATMPEFMGSVQLEAPLHASSEQQANFPNRPKEATDRGSGDLAGRPRQQELPGDDA